MRSKTDKTVEIVQEDMGDEMKEFDDDIDDLDLDN